MDLQHFKINLQKNFQFEEDGNAKYCKQWIYFLSVLKLIRGIIFFDF
jgi:hypothetical protein